MPVGKRRTGSGNSRRKGTFKTKQRKAFNSRHIDQVWEDVRKQQEEILNCSADGKERLGPVGTTSRAVLDEDTPAGGAFYCTPCSRYFLSEHALSEHSRTKPHKRRLKELEGARPHNQKDAEWAGCMGAADNGQKSKPVEMES
ncbi:g2373 [Coccomyxa elongata]